MNTSSKQSRIAAALALLAMYATMARAAEPAAPATPPPSGPTYMTLDQFANSPNLTGDWGGIRNKMADKGLTVDIYSTQIYQGVTSGGLDKGWNYGGRENATIKFDTGKAGLWPGGFLTIEGEGNYGEFVGARQTGALLPADNNLAFPNTDGPQFDLVQVNYTQFLCHYFGVYLGKLDLTSGDANVFAHGKGESQFLNTGFGFNPIFSITAPPYALGGGAVILPTGDPNEFLITMAIFDTEGQASTSGFDTVFKGGTSYAAEGRYTTHFFKLTGHQLLGGVYSDKLYTAVGQPLRNFIIPGIPIQTHSGAWCAYYNFDQYIYQPDPKSDIGLGVFGRFGISDGEANPIHYFGSIGLGGKGLIPGRKNDQFGVGVYQACASTSAALDTLGFGQSRGYEAYYEAAITPAILLSPDIQYIEPSQQRVDPSLVLGVRLTVKF